MKVKDLDEMFDNGEDIIEHIDLSKAKRIKQKHEKIDVEFPTWMLNSLDKEARRLGIPIQSIIKVWIADRLKLTAVTSNQ